MTPDLGSLFDRATSEGTPFPEGVRGRLERAIGGSLSDARVHVGPTADRVARAFDADACTRGSDIYFRDGEYRPDTLEGLQLLAHESMHVVQQRSGPIADGVDVGGWTLGRPGGADELEADAAARLVATGGRAPRPANARPERRRAAAPSRTVQLHVSFEHRLLGDGPTADLVAISMNGPNRQAILTNQITLLGLWQDDPGAVTEAQINRLCPWIRTVRLGPDQVLATYGEVNALPDYLADAQTIDALPEALLLPILQVIRQEGFNQLMALLTGKNPGVEFYDAACAPWQLSMVNNIMETQALDLLTSGLGARGENHYQGLLARNACHFAPHSWYRWQSSHVIARDLAVRAHATGDASLVRQAWAYHGYADHFLQDSFAAGHLVNKTLVMQWFIEWAADQSLLPIADWDSIKDMTTVIEPQLGGRWLYDPTCQGPSNDPQTSQELSTLIGRSLAGGVIPVPGSDQARSYQEYLTFLTSAATQLASANLHDHYNTTSLWVASIGHPAPYEVWGDDTLFSGANGGEGVQCTSSTAQLSQGALIEILQTGSTTITTEAIRQQFPTRAGSDPASLQDLEAWSDTQKEFCVDSSFPAFWTELKTLLMRLVSPRLGVVSQDQNFGSVWSTSLPSCGLQIVNSIFVDGRMYAGSNGYVYELDPTSGQVKNQLLVSGPVGVGNYETRLACDGTTLFAGVHGYLYGIRLDDWSRPAWTLQVGNTGYQTVAVLLAAGRLFAASNGYVYEVDPPSGRQIHSLLLGSIIGQGDYDSSLAFDDASAFLFAGLHGYVYAVDATAWTVLWDTAVGGLAAYDPASVLLANGTLYAASNGHVYELVQFTGHVLHDLLVTGSIGVGDYTTRIAADGATLFVGVHGYVYGVTLTDWSKAAWDVAIGGAIGYQPVDVLAQAGRLFAASNGYAYQLAPGADGTIAAGMLLTSLVPTGSFTTRLSCDGRDLYAGVHGYQYKLLVDDASVEGRLFHNWAAPDGSWGWWDLFDGAPPAFESVTGCMAPTGNLAMFLTSNLGTLSVTWQTPDGNWHGWTPVPDSPGFVQSTNACVGASGNLELWAVERDGTLTHNWMSPDGVWHGWQAGFDGVPGKVQSVTSSMGWKGTYEVFAVGLDGSLYHDWQTPDGSWQGWESGFQAAPPIVQSVAAAMGPAQDYEVLVVGRGGVVFRNCMTPAGWHDGWSSTFGGPLPPVQSVSMGMGASGNLEAHAVGLDGTYFHNWVGTDGEWRTWTAGFGGAPGKLAGPVSSALLPGGNLQVFAIGGDGILWNTWQWPDGNWGGWTASLEGAPPQVLSVTTCLGAGGNVEMFVVAE